MKFFRVQELFKCQLARRLPFVPVIVPPSWIARPFREIGAEGIVSQIWGAGVAFDSAGLLAPEARRRPSRAFSSPSPRPHEMLRVAFGSALGLRRAQFTT